MSKVDLKIFFSNPSGRQKQYEALRAIFLEEIPYNKVADNLDTRPILYIH